MKVLFVHQNFPAQFRHVAGELSRDPANRVVAIGAENSGWIRGVEMVRYALGQPDVTRTHAFARRFDIECRRAEQILYAGQSLRSSGFVPDTVLAHHGWGETIPLRAAFPEARIVAYCEYYYQAQGGDVGFDPSAMPLTADAETALRARNAATLLALAECDVAVSATEWQRSTFPAEFQHKIRVIHEGIDTDEVRPDPDATFSPRAGLVLRQGDEVVTFVARDLEPLRGYLSFMHSLPAILSERPRAHVVIVGGDGTSYGAAPPLGDTWKAIGLRAVECEIDLARVHFVGRIERADFIRVLQVSACHVYLTMPFVLSWSMLEAMAAGCALVASDTPPCQEVVRNDVNGRLVPFFAPAAVSAAVTSLLADRTRSRALGAAARRTIEKDFGVRGAVAAMVRLIAGAQARNDARRTTAPKASGDASGKAPPLSPQRRVAR